MKLHARLEDGAWRRNPKGMKKAPKGVLGLCKFDCDTGKIKGAKSK